MIEEEKAIIDAKSDDELVHTWKVITGRLKKAKGAEKLHLERMLKYVEKLRKKTVITETE